MVLGKSITLSPQISDLKITANSPERTINKISSQRMPAEKIFPHEREENIYILFDEISAYQLIYASFV